ncbi:MAG: DegT/DnrJ/EryC1/StrS family aminotransferase [Bryobacteraceae bacterium]
MGQAEIDAVRQVFDGHWLGLGRFTERFEESLRERVGARHVIAVNSGTAALHLALQALDLAAGDEVLVPSLTFVSPVQMILASGARPVFCEVEPGTLNLDPDDVARRITPRTRAVLPVHYGGYACSLDPILALARERGLYAIDDAAHAFGSHYRGRPIGAWCDLTCFSFDPIKNITCVEGGAVATDNDEWARQIRLRRNLGINADSWNRLEFARSWEYSVEAPGFRYAMPNLNAAIGLAQLARCDEFRRRKQEIVRQYDAELGLVAGVTILEKNIDDSFPFSYVIRVDPRRRDPLLAHLRQAGIGAMVQFTPNHLQPRFRDPAVRLPVTESLYGEILTLPLYVEMTGAEVAEVIETVRRFLTGTGRHAHA